MKYIAYFIPGNTKKNENISTKKYNINTFYFLYSKSKIYLTKYFGGVKHGKIFKYGQSG